MNCLSPAEITEIALQNKIIFEPNEEQPFTREPGYFLSVVILKGSITIDSREGERTFLVHSSAPSACLYTEDGVAFHMRNVSDEKPAEFILTSIEDVRPEDEKGRP